MAGPTPCFLAMSLMTGSSNTLGSSSPFFGRPGLPNGLYASN